MRDHQPITVDNFLGTFNRGEDEVVPQGFFIDSLNLRFSKNGAKTREGSRISISTSSIRRAAVFKKTGENQRIIFLDNSGSLWDSSSLSSAILTIPGMTDFSLVPIFNRAYITPHNGLTGLQNEKVYVYDGNGPARGAAGDPPLVSGSLTLTEPGSGNIEAGDRVFAVCFLKSSGYLTSPGYYTTISTAGAKNLKIAGIPTGDSDTIARVIIGTQVIPLYDGVPTDQTYFEIPGGVLEDNISTEVTVDFADAELISDVTYLLEQLDSIPAGVGIGSFNGRMIVWGEFDFPAILRASLPGSPESFNAVDGFVTVNPGDSDEGVKNAVEIREQLIISKSRRTYGTQDSGDPVSAWKVVPVDKSVGTECHGYGKVLDFGADMQDAVFVADRGGLRLYTGSFGETPLSQNIHDIWSAINGDAFHTVEIVVDPTDDRVYVCVPLGTASRPNCVLYGDFHEGLDQIKWTTWTFPDDPVTILLDVVKGQPVFKFGTLGGNLYELNEGTHRDYGNPIESYAKFSLLPVNDDSQIFHFTGARFRIKGNGKVLVTVEGLNGSNPMNGQNIVLDQNSMASSVSLFDFTGEVCSVKIRMEKRDEFFTLTKYTLYYNKLWETNG